MVLPLSSITTKTSSSRLQELATKATEEIRVPQVQQDLLVLKVLLVLQDSLVQLAPLVLRAQLDRKVMVEIKALLARRGLQVHKDLQVRLASQALQAQLDPPQQFQVQLARLVQLVLAERQVLKEFKE
jgi:hypothetical protein